MTSDNFFLDTQPLYLDDVVNDFGQLKNVPTSLKHSNGKYMLCNAELSNRDGIAIEEYIELTAHDLGRMTKRKPAVVLHAVETDKQLFEKKASFINYKHALLTHDKHIVVEEVFKRPVLGSRNQVACVLCSGQNITHHAHPMFLFRLYESHLPTQEAIQHFLQYKQLDTYFRKSLNREELVTLITMRDIKSIPEIASKLQFTTSDIEHYQTQLREKLSILSLDEIVELLAWYSPDEAKDAIGGLET